ncbi:MAG: hypothetical protein COV67_13175 [Nitrospinae bacterium CG11_big_fil_rev_8_21_14_0_20_56_8]|nr:MAG: hypothetical protein COV67_13175 [Nitrospinae bacterium CG11_big_fil_rev_8_21_14_0_20_56_8]
MIAREGEHNGMPLKTIISRLVLLTFLLSSLVLQGCSYIPWIGQDEEPDVVFEDLGTEEKPEEGAATSEDAFFAEGEGGFMDVDKEFASIEQPTDKGELKGDVENLQSQQEALTGKVRQLEEMVKTLEPKISATQQRLEGSLAAAQGKTEFLEPEVTELKKQIVQLQGELAQLKQAKSQAMAKAESKKVRMARVSQTPPDYNRALAAYKNKNYDESILLFQSLALSNPPSNLQDNIVFWIGSNYLQLEMYDDAIEQFESVLNKYPNGNKVHDSRYMLGLAYAKKGDTSKAVEILQAALKGNPGMEVRKKIQKKLQEIQ